MNEDANPPSYAGENRVRGSDKDGIKKKPPVIK